jgi:serine phosphatase RsbU (regulator of sigma subunit)/anti-sigma regulatory factor (Ser/Thr protein kinase)
VNAQIVRRTRLPADHNSPGLARVAVRGALQEAALGAVQDEALLLTTELVTNSVVHAGTEVDLEIIAGGGSVTVSVLDFKAGPLLGSAAGADTADLAERGRGLHLVDALADAWGTLHFADGKGVWFRLDVAGATRPVAGVRNPLQAPPPEALTALSAYSGLRENAGLNEAAEEMLRQLCGVVGAAGIALVVDEGDGPRTIAAVGRVSTSSDSGLRLSLRLTKPWRGELVVTGGTPDAYLKPLAALTADRIALLVENHRLRRADSERRTWLTFLAEVSELLAQSLDVELTLALIPRLVVPRLGRWCAVHIAEDSGDLRLAAAAHADERELPELLEHLTEAERPLKEAMSSDAVVSLSGAVEGHAVGLLARGQQLGTLTIGRDHDTWQRTEEVAVVEDVARRAALAIDNARIHAERRTIARTLQRSLLPPRLPKVEGIEFGAEYVPAGEAVDVGGDFYDVVPLSERRWLVVVGDVSGKGVQAATVTGLVRDVTRVLVRDGRPLSEVLTRLNETLVERGSGRFCTLCLAAVTRRSDNLLDVTLHLAGHDQPVLVHADGTTSVVGINGTALGLLDTVKSPATRVPLAPGDTLIFYTDGVTERRRGPDLFGVDRLRREAAVLAGFPAEVVAARLRAATLNYSPEPPRDDIAIFAVRNDATA